MQEASQYLVGTHDFKSFCAAKTQAQTTVRTVTGIEVEAHPLSEGEYPSKKVIIRVTGEGFLYNMVRIISGTLIKVGLGVYPQNMSNKSLRLATAHRQEKPFRQKDCF